MSGVTEFRWLWEKWMCFFNSMLRHMLAIGLLLVLTGFAVEQEKARTWTDVTGRHKVVATLVRSTKTLVTLRKQDGKTWAALFSPSSEMLLTCGGGLLNRERYRGKTDALIWRKRDNTMRLWDVRRRVEIVQFGSGEYIFWKAVLLPDSKIAALTSGVFRDRVEHQIQIWSVPENLRKRFYGKATPKKSNDSGASGKK